MKSKLLVIILTAFGFTITTAQGQWVIIDTLYSFNQCTLPFPYQTNLFSKVATLPIIF
ncbi:MAG: hypothetical protein IPN13_22075 [Bacteroidetes bacterium]|nr:hypothetical protein [Bacteroidota bacterium]